jgi:transposase-like protein
MRHRPPAIKDNFREHVEAMGVDYDKLIWLFENGFNNASIARALGPVRLTIRKWRTIYEEDKKRRTNA